MKLYTFIIITAISGQMSAQSVERSSINPSSLVYIEDALRIESTIGQSVTGVSYTEETDFTQGFAQPLYIQSIHHDIDNSDYVVYPNPTYDHIKIKASKHSQYSVTLLAMDGSLLLDTECIDCDIHSIDVSRYPAGQYALKISAENNSKSYLITITQ